MKHTLVAAAVWVATGSSQAQSATYAIEPTHTFVTFEAKHFGTSTTRGRFDRKEGTVTLDRAAGTGKAEITLQLGSVSTGVAALDATLKGKEFFGAAENAQATFVGDSVTFNGPKLASIAGLLSMRGKAVPITLTATHFNCYDHLLFRREVCGGDFEATLQPSRWGLDLAPIPGLPDTVRLLVQVEAIKQ